MAKIVIDCHYFKEEVALIGLFINIKIERFNILQIVINAMFRQQKRLVLNMHHQGNVGITFTKVIQKNEIL